MGQSETPAGRLKGTGSLLQLREAGATSWAGGVGWRFEQVRRGGQGFSGWS